MASSIWLSSFIFYQMHSVIKTLLYLLSEPSKHIYSLFLHLYLILKCFFCPSAHKIYVRVDDNSESGSDQSGATMIYFPSGYSQFIRGEMILASR